MNKRIRNPVINPDSEHPGGGTSRLIMNGRIRNPVIHRVQGGGASRLISDPKEEVKSGLRPRGKGQSRSQIRSKRFRQISDPVRDQGDSNPPITWCPREYHDKGKDTVRAESGGLAQLGLGADLRGGVEG